jgi:hypothetical protein
MFRAVKYRLHYWYNKYEEIVYWILKCEYTSCRKRKLACDVWESIKETNMAKWILSFSVYGVEQEAAADGASFYCLL